MDQELKKYLLEQCRAWMLPEELKALRRIFLTEQGELSVKKIALADIKMEILYGFNDEKTNALANLDEDELELKIAFRLLRDHKDTLINNCPQCAELARTPYAKQCRHCGYDWH